MKKWIFVLVIVLLIGCTPNPQPADVKNLTDDDIYRESRENETQETPEEPIKEPSKTTETEETAEIPKEPEKTVQEIPSISDEIFEGSNTTKKNASQGNIQSSRCQDSDATDEFPDGINLKMKGTITVNGKPIYGGVDFCTTTKQVSEWYCQNGIPRVYVYSCPANCQDAVCVELP